MLFFEQFSEFVDRDVRKDRLLGPSTAESLTYKHEVILPDELIKDKTILDLGSCIGATGHWVLSKGARHYTGVEVQKEFYDIGQELLSKHWQQEYYNLVKQDIRDFLDDAVKNNKHYDVVVLMGVLYAFVDVVGLLRNITKICDVVVLDCTWARGAVSPDYPILDIIRGHKMMSTDGVFFQGAGTRATPAALKNIMETLNFEDREGVLVPKPVSEPNIADGYTKFYVEDFSEVKTPKQWRFILRFYKNKNLDLKEVSDYIVENKQDKKVDAYFGDIQIQDQGIWKFDDEVAQRFQREAETHIPDYKRVILKSISIASISHKGKRNVAVVDVGSALGFTVDEFIKKDFTNVIGIESSESMIKNSLHQDKIIHSEKFVPGSYDVVCANWTLHFIQQREQYLKDIFNSLNSEGILILTDKMSYSRETEVSYHKWKEQQGVSKEEIQRKKNSIIGVLTTKPLTWYLEILKNIGFEDIQVINASFMFVTIYAKKL